MPHRPAIANPRDGDRESAAIAMTPSAMLRVRDELSGSRAAATARLANQGDKKMTAAAANDAGIIFPFS
jgi:hypothetical protein